MIDSIFPSDLSPNSVVGVRTGLANFTVRERSGILDDAGDKISRSGKRVLANQKYRQAQPGALTQGLAQVGRVLTGDHWLSVSVGAHRQTPSEIADVFYEVRALSRPHCLLQVEGTPMSGGLGGGDDRSLELVKEVMHLAPDAAVQIAGGTDLGTAQRCHAAQLLVVGIAFGTFARLQVAAALDAAGEGMRIDPEILQQSIENARQLVHSVRSPEQWSF